MINGVSTNELSVLSNKEMIPLFIALQNGSEDAKQQLINGNLKLVLSIVQRFANRCDNMDDVFQVGCIGLIKAIDNFDLKHEVRFSTYAVPMIMGEIKRYLRDNQVMRVSRHLKDLSYQIYHLKEAYIQTHHQEPSVDWIAKQLQVKQKDIMDAMDSCQSVISIFEPIYNSDGDELYLMDQIMDQKDRIEELQNYMTLKKSLLHLHGNQKHIIMKRYYQDKTQMEIAEELGISQAQVSRLEKQAIQELKKEFER